MSKPRLRFVNIQECEIFLTRYLSPEFIDGTFFLATQIDALEAVEKSCKASPSWRLSNNYCDATLETLSQSHEVEELVTKLKQVEILCGGSTNSTPSAICKYCCAQPTFTNDDESDDISSKMRVCVDLLLCLLSPALDYRDIWSVTRLLGRVCPETLPALRRRAERTDGDLNIMSVLLSYTMANTIEGSHGDDPILADNFETLKKFTDTVTEITDLLQDEKPMAITIRELVKTAVGYLNSLKKFNSLDDLSRLQQFIHKHFCIVTDNFDALLSTAPNTFQNLSIYSKKHVLAFALRDRLVCLDCITQDGAASPLFKSPLAQSTASSSTQQVTQDGAVDDQQQQQELTPNNNQAKTSGRFVPFINFDTPESNEEVVASTVRSVDSGIVSDIYYPGKENLDPDAVVLIDQCTKDTETPIRPNKKNARLRIRDKNRQETANTEKSKARKRCCMDDGAKTAPKAKCKTKAPPKLAAGQTTLLSFFGR